MAIAHAVASELKECDKMDRPLYTIKTTTRHEISLEETCVPQVSDNSCHVITGVTEILLDYFSANARDKSYDSIEDLFSNKEMMQLFAPAVAYATFLGPINEILVIEGDDSNNVPGVTVAVLVFTAACAFCVASIICYGLMRDGRKKENTRYKRRRIYSSFNPRMISRKGRSYMIRLEDVASSCSSLVGKSFPKVRNHLPLMDDFVESRIQASQSHYAHSITWSVSDITSDDSESIRSNLSRATSWLERIEEGEEDEESRLKTNVLQKKKNVGDYDYPQLLQRSILESDISSFQNLLVMLDPDGDLEEGMSSSGVSNDLDIQLLLENLPNKDDVVSGLGEMDMKKIEILEEEDSFPIATLQDLLVEDGIELDLDIIENAEGEVLENRTDTSASSLEGSQSGNQNNVDLGTNENCDDCLVNATTKDDLTKTNIGKALADTTNFPRN